MADSTSTDLAYTPTTWADGADGGTAITAARLNNIEQGINAATTQVNANTKEIKTLGDSVSHFEIGGRVADVQFKCNDTSDSKLTMQVTFTDGNWWAIDFFKDVISIYDYATNTSKSMKLA